jgi:asparagine synthase (glutamine-hydrolysing)
VLETLSSERAFARGFVDNRKVVSQIDSEPRFGRKIWGLFCLELWQRAFHDRAQSFRERIVEVAA